MAAFTLNGTRFEYEDPADTPLLWVLRDSAGATGTKFGCGAGLCGACMVHLDGRAVRACVTPVSVAEGAEITTIEGLAPSDAELHPVQQAWIEQDVAQCGYCQAGQIMAVADLLQRIPRPSDEDIDAQHSNLCRCGTYSRIRKAIHRAAELQAQGGES